MRSRRKVTIQSRSQSFKTVTISDPGAELLVERIELSEEARRGLTTHVTSIGAPKTKSERAPASKAQTPS
jgi:hypothetical protein